METNRGFVSKRFPSLLSGRAPSGNSRPRKWGATESTLSLPCCPQPCQLPRGRLRHTRLGRPHATGGQCCGGSRRGCGGRLRWAPRALLPGPSRLLPSCANARGCLSSLTLPPGPSGGSRLGTHGLHDYGRRTGSLKRPSL